MKQNILTIGYLLIVSLTMSSSCSKGQNGSGSSTDKGATVDWWLTKGDQSVLLQKQNAVSFTANASSGSTIEVDSATAYQQVDGFGYTLTGGSAMLINRMDPAAKSALLTELFGSGANGIAISYLRLSIGASDLDASVFSYNDLPAGQTDVPLASFSLSRDTVDLIPVLKQILAINPNIKIMGSPWSPPVWMKDNNNSIGGSLKPQYYSVYSKYFVKYIQAMATKGIMINAVTLQNEPQHGGNNPSMIMSAANQADFVKNHLGPAFQAAGIITKIIVWDHNCDNPTYPVTVLDDAAARPFIDGSAFHLYAGDISALSTVHNAYPNKNLYFTEQWTGANGSFDGDLKWHVANVVIGSMRNWSRTALEWNLASDPSYNPHTPGGCTECRGALTISGSAVTRNVGYYIIAHASKFIPTGSTRIGSTELGGIRNAAFVTPAGKKVLVVMNDGTASATFNIKYQGKWASVQLPAGAAGSFIW
ncbi:MAG: glycoside hydrolase family 30 beta sandwich domain-containing protein [Bacteroidota bacterium]